MECARGLRPHGSHAAHDDRMLTASGVSLAMNDLNDLICVVESRLAIVLASRRVLHGRVALV